MKETPEMKPCPLCGRPVRVAHMIIGTIRHVGGAEFMECSAKIECACGLSFEKDWTEYAYNGMPFQLYPGNEHIVTAWNRRVSNENSDPE